ncbi:MAG: glycosyltransferase family 2 protein [Myxococcota bacterium]
MKLSIVSTLYKSESYVAEFCERCELAAQSLVGDSYEIILVNDGSPDRSLSLALKAQKTLSNLVVLDLSRNFGHHKAIMAGLHESSGDKIFMIDCDLEVAPESLIDFWNSFEHDASADVIVATVESKGNSFFKGLLSNAFYFIYNKLVDLKLDNKELATRLMNRSYLDALLQYPEYELYLGGLLHDVGFKQVNILVSRTSNKVSSYSLKKRVDLALTALFSFSSKPSLYIFYSGIFFSAISVGYSAFIISQKLISGRPLLGWTSLMAAICVIGGITISSIGIIGIYTSKIFFEVKNRPLYHIKKIYRHGN